MGRSRCYSNCTKINRFGLSRHTSQFLGLLECFFIQFDIFSEQNLGLINPLITLDAAGEEFDRFIDLKDMLRVLFLSGGAKLQYFGHHSTLKAIQPKRRPD